MIKNNTDQQPLLQVAKVIDQFSLFIGKCQAWMVIAMVLVTLLVVVLRYGLNIGYVSMQESITYLHATVFLLGAGYCYQQDAHVRVDIFYRHFSEQHKAWVNAVGNVVFLLPVSCFILGTSWGLFESSWQIKETSSEAGGLPLVYLLKGLIPLMALLLILQGLSNLLRNLVTLISKP